MTPTEILTSARQRYNAIGDSFFGEDELLNYLYDACLEMNREANLIERTYSTTSVASQQEYAYPGDTALIKRLTYAGKKLKPITMREDDSITGLNQSTVSTGTPQYYFIWNETISLRPIPSTAGDTIKIYAYNEPAALTISSVLEIPTQFHMDLAKYMVMEMAAKDKQFEHADRYERKWEKAVVSAKRWAKKKLRGDSFNVVQDEDMMVEGYLGIV